MNGADKLASTMLAAALADNKLLFAVTITSSLQIALCVIRYAFCDSICSVLFWMHYV